MKITSLTTRCVQVNNNFEILSIAYIFKVFLPYNARPGTLTEGESSAQLASLYQLILISCFYLRRFVFFFIK